MRKGGIILFLFTFLVLNCSKNTKEEKGNVLTPQMTTFSGPYHIESKLSKMVDEFFKNEIWNKIKKLKSPSDWQIAYQLIKDKENKFYSKKPSKKDIFFYKFIKAKVAFKALRSNYAKNGKEIIRNYEEARKIAEELGTEVEKEHAFILLDEQTVYIKMGDYDNAIKIGKELINNHPKIEELPEPFMISESILGGISYAYRQKGKIDSLKKYLIEVEKNFRGTSLGLQALNELIQFSIEENNSERLALYTDVLDSYYSSQPQYKLIKERIKYYKK